MTPRRPPSGCGARGCSPSSSAAPRKPPHSQPLPPRQRQISSFGSSDGLPQHGTFRPLPPCGRELEGVATAFRPAYVAFLSPRGGNRRSAAKQASHKPAILGASIPLLPCPGASMLRISRNLLIDENDIEIAFVRASGPG